MKPVFPLRGFRLFHVVNPLTVAEAKKLRLVLDLRYILVFSRVHSLNTRTFKCFWRFLSQVFISLLLVLKRLPSC